MRRRWPVSSPGARPRAADLLAAARRRARAVNPRVNAIVRWLDDEADERVREHADRTVRRRAVPAQGAAPGPGRRADIGGVPGTGRHVSAETDTVVQRWLDAGLVVFGQTNTPEFGAKAVTEPDLFGPTRNPWDLRRTPGARRAARRRPWPPASCRSPAPATAADRSASRPPAADCSASSRAAGWCRPGPTGGEGFHGPVTDGVISRSVRDTAAMLDVLAGADPTAPFSPAVPERPLRRRGRAVTGPADHRVHDRRRRVNPSRTPRPSPPSRTPSGSSRELGHEVEAVDRGDVAGVGRGLPGAVVRPRRHRRR